MAGFRGSISSVHKEVIRGFLVHDTVKREQ